MTYRSEGGANPTVAQLVPEWRGRATNLRQWGAAEGPARAWEDAATELEAALRAADAELLTLEQAATESGYSTDHLGRLVRQGKVPNAGRQHSPRIRRGDLPRKVGILPVAPVIAISRVQIARSVVNSHKERNDG